MQEEIIPFFQSVTLSPENNDVFSCYLELAEKVCALALPVWLAVRQSHLILFQKKPECGRELKDGSPLRLFKSALLCRWPVQVRAGLSHLDPYFSKLADGMVAWIESWQKLNP